MNRGFPGSSKSTGQLQISASLLFDVFTRHEAQNRLLLEAQQEGLDDPLKISGLEAALERAACQEWLHVKPQAKPTGLPAAGGTPQQQHEQ
jgi:ATP-dependent Lhr-like helicase